MSYKFPKTKNSNQPQSKGNKLASLCKSMSRMPKLPLINSIYENKITKKINNCQDLETKFLLNHKHNMSWNIANIGNYIDLSDSHKIYQITEPFPGTIDEEKTKEILQEKNEHEDYLKSYNKNLDDLIIQRPSEPESESKTRYYQKKHFIKESKKKIKENERRKNLKAETDVSLLKKMQAKKNIFIKINEINNGQPSNDITKITCFPNLIMQSKNEANFKKSFIKHVHKLKEFREKMKGGQTNESKIQEMIINNYRKQNKIQMKIENNKKIESLKMLGDLIDFEISEQEITVTKLIESFQNTMNSNSFNI